MPGKTILKILSTQIKDAGIAIHRSRERILFYTAGSGNGLEGLAAEATEAQKEVDPKKRHLFVIEKHIEDVKQGQKCVLDLLKSIMEFTDPAKEELRRILSNNEHGLI